MRRHLQVVLNLTQSVRFAVLTLKILQNLSGVQWLSIRAIELGHSCWQSSCNSRLQLVGKGGGLPRGWAIRRGHGGSPFIGGGSRRRCYNLHPPHRLSKAGRCHRASLISTMSALNQFKDYFKLHSTMSSRILTSRDLFASKQHYAKSPQGHANMSSSASSPHVLA